MGGGKIEKVKVKSYKTQWGLIFFIQLIDNLKNKLLNGSCYKVQWGFSKKYQLDVTRKKNVDSSVTR